MPDRTRYYAIGAFLLGVALTAEYKKQSSNLEERPENDDLNRQRQLVARFAKLNGLDTLEESWRELENLLEKGAGGIKEGIEGCIGDTPLIKIKSLSEYTGCEILAKAEVCLWKL
jgi:cysteine synthase A